MSAFASIERRFDAGVLHLTLNRPEVRNAMSRAMVRELQEALDVAETDPQVRVIVLRGAGGHFCAGGDIHDMVAARSAGKEAIANLSEEFGRLCAAYAQSSKAVVAVVEGTVMGGGFGLACVADVTLAGESAVFSLPEVTLGIVPAQIAPFLVERLGYAEAKRLALTAARIDAQEALSLRLVHEVHPPGLLDTALQRVLNTLMRGAPGAIAASKALLRRTRLVPAQALIDEAAAVFAEAVQGDEGREGGMAFIEKRKPMWAPR
jgi:isohexenylglutaconyl-CoA hydratase